jgi:hypothetical protein
MDLFDDYQDEVERLTDAEIDTLLSGADRLAGSVATLIRDVRLDLLENPSPDVAARHLAAMAAVRPQEPVRPNARAARRRRHLLPRKRLTAIAFAAALLFLAGLAAAVTLPNKPDQPDPGTLPTTAPSVAPTEELAEEPTHGRAVAEVAKDPALTGCEKGQAVAAVASAKAAEPRSNPDQKNDPCARGETRGEAKPRGRGDPPVAADGVAEGRDNSDAAGRATANAPGLNQDSVERGSEARGRGIDRGDRAGGLVGAGGLGGGGGSGAAPTDSPKP